MFVLTRYPIGLAILALAIVTVAPWTMADVSRQINYQGFLRDSNGDPVSGSVNLHFYIFNDSIGGEACWDEAWEDHPVVDGLFELQLGSRAPIEPECVSEAPKWLEVWVNGGHLEPRKPISSVPSTFAALNADRLDGFDASAFAVASHTHSLGELSDVELGTPAEGDLLIFQGGQWIPTPQASVGIRMKVSSYTGDGQTTQAIAGVGFCPDWVKVQGEGTHPVYKHKDMPENISFLANGYSGTDYVRTLDSDGFTVGSYVNQSGMRYYYVAYAE